MIARKPVFSTPDEVESVFYEAFIHCDWQVMASLWADGDVVCVHPGAGLISGYEKVMRSWKHILENAQPPSVNFEIVHRTDTDGLSVHLVVEEISSQGAGKALVLATNVYQKTGDGWHMIEHHASLVEQQQTPVRH